MNKHAHNAIIARDLNALLASGVDVPRALELLAKQYRHKKICKALGDCADHTKRGIAFSQALTHHPKVFSPIFTKAVYHAEQSGNLPAAFNTMLPVLTQTLHNEAHLRAHTLEPIKILLTAIAIGVVAIAIALFIPLL